MIKIITGIVATIVIATIMFAITWPPIPIGVVQSIAYSIQWLYAWNPYFPVDTLFQLVTIAFFIEVSIYTIKIAMWVGALLRGHHAPIGFKEE